MKVKEIEARCKELRVEIIEIDKKIDTLEKKTLTKQVEKELINLSDMRYELNLQLSKEHDRIYEIKRNQYRGHNQKSLNFCPLYGCSSLSVSSIKRHGLSGVSL